MQGEGALSPDRSSANTLPFGELACISALGRSSSLRACSLERSSTCISNIAMPCCYPLLPVADFITKMGLLIGRKLVESGMSDTLCL
jgi:hypothetical protein